MRWGRYVFFIFWAITLLSFIPSIGAGFVYDFLGWQKEYNEGSFRDIINCFGYNGNHQFLHLIFYSFYQLFSIQGLPWYILFSTLHAVNGYLLYLLILRMMQQWSGSISPLLAALGAAAFLVHPYSVEPAVWRVCVHYLISLMAVLLIFILFLEYMETGKRKLILSASILFILSLFTLEVSFITPVALTFCGVLIYLIAVEKKKIVQSVVRFGGMLWLLLGAYVLLNKLTLGSLVGHYGENIHFRFNLLSIVSAEMKYFVKHLFYARLYDYKVKNMLFDQILSYPEVAFFYMVAIISGIILYFIKIKKIAPRWHTAFLGIIVSMLFVLPVANIYFFHLHIGMNDRYSYIPMAFLTMAIVAGLSQAPRWLGYILIGSLLAVNIFYQQKTLKYWHESTEVLTGLKKNFRWNDSPYVFILNSPDNMEGIVMASIINEPSGIDEIIDYQTSRPFNGKMFDVFQYNMTTPNDGVKVEQADSMQLKVTFNQWGNWWHRNGIGGTSYENEYYKAETLDYPYLITFKQFPEGSVILYQVGKEWREFKFKGDD